VVFGEYALEYLKRLSPRFRLYAGVEGNQGEVEWIVEGNTGLGTRSAEVEQRFRRYVESSRFRAGDWRDAPFLDAVPPLDGRA